MQDLNRLRSIYQSLKANPGLAISRMYTSPDGQGHWSFTGCAHAGGFWLTTDDIRQLWTGDMLIQQPAGGVQWVGENRFKYGSFQFNPQYDPPAYLEKFTSRPFWMYPQNGPA